MMLYEIAGRGPGADRWERLGGALGIDGWERLGGALEMDRWEMPFLSEISPGFRVTQLTLKVDCARQQDQQV